MGPVTVLSAPSTFDERTDPTDPHNSCGENQAASALKDKGTPQSPPTIESWIAANPNGHLNPYTAGTWPDEISSAARHFGMAAHAVYQADLETCLDAAVGERRHRLLWVVQCDANAQPVPAGSTNIGHWLQFYGNVDPVPTMQCWGGINRTYPLALLKAASLGDGVEIDEVMPADQPRPQPVHILGGGEMLAPRPDGSGIDIFVMGGDGDGQLYTATLKPDGTLYGAPYEADAWKGHPIDKPLGACWLSPSLLVVAVKGTDGEVYESRYAGTWSGFAGVGFAAA